MLNFKIQCFTSTHGWIVLSSAELVVVIQFEMIGTALLAISSGNV